MTSDDLRADYTITQLLRLRREPHAVHLPYRQPVGRWLRDDADNWRPGALGVYLDNVLGNPLITEGSDRTRGLLTTGLSVDFVPRSDPGPGPLEMPVRIVHADRAGGLSTGELRNAAGETLAVATLSGRFTERTGENRGAPAAPPSTPELSMTEILGAIRRPTQDGAVLTVEPGRWIANVRGTLHGGVAVSLLEYAASAALGEATWLASSFRVDFTRPTSVDRPLEVHATVLKRGRSLAFVQARLGQAGSQSQSMAMFTYLAA